MNTQFEAISQNFRSNQWLGGMARGSALILLLAVFALPSSAQWTTTWSDEFDGPAGSFPNATNWTYDVGNNNGWGNAELEVYCAAGSNTAPCNAANPNVFMDGNGHLVIRAIRNQNGIWTSTRMKTQGLQQFQYGRLEARIKLTVGNGLWPAFWMLGSDITTVPWPRCGEQDIMEWVDFYTPNSTSSTAHGPGYSGGSGIGGRFFFPNGGRIDDASYHTYGVVWSPYKLQFYRDDWTQPFLTVTPTIIPVGSQWVYDNPFFILLNQAVGGNWFPGPDATTPGIADMLVDYVRVMQWNSGAPDAPRNLRAKSRASNQIELKWQSGHDGQGDGHDPGSDGSDAYDIYASTAPNFQPSFSNLVVQNFHGTRYIHQGLNPSTTYYYQVLSVNLGGESLRSNVASATTQPFGHGRGISMNAGGYAVEQFATENFAAGGFTNYHSLTIDTSAVAHPAPQGVYQTEHWGASDWAIPNLDPSATYLLRLHFVENTFTAAGKRLFNVVINGEQVLSSFDIYATAGAMSKAVVEDFVVTPDENGIVSLQFVPGAADQPTVSGIELLPTDSEDEDVNEAAATVVVGSTGGTTARIAINAGGPVVGTFLADTDFAGGRNGSMSKFVDISKVTNPAPEQVYLTQRVGTGIGSFGYFIPNLIPGATYKVRLHFAEGFFSQSGSRVFNVAMDGQTVLSNFDIWAAAGATNTAVINEFSAKADRYGLVMLQFLVGTANLPSLRGIEVIETAPPPSAPPEPDRDE
ncbi:MAG TPA: malectin domain-containing carbohydrate-binding protein [Terriglobales bacterium]|nr:malectin domain-containing carbohydrate-binding protein [Terriglobales bacterium]